MIYCVISENLVSPHGITHLRSLKERRKGELIPIFPQNKATIHVCDRLYIARTLNGDTIAASTELQPVVSRIKHAQPHADIRIRYGDKDVTVTQYEDANMPTFYRIAYTDGMHTGWIAAIDVIEDGKASDIKLFYDVDELRSYIDSRQRGDGNYYTYGPRRVGAALGGLDRYDVPSRFDDYDHLREKLTEIRKENIRKHSKTGAADTPKTELKEV